MKKNKKMLFIYTMFISLISTSVFASECFVCGNTYFPLGISTLVRNIFNLIKVLVPVIIIIMGMIDLLKAVIASDEKKMSEATPKLIRKLISGIMIFLILSIVQFVFKNVLNNNGLFTDSMMDCVNYFIAEEPDAIACPEREDNVTQYVKKAKILKCINKSKSECKGECSWGYHNGAQTAYCAPKGKAASTPCDGLALQACSQTSGCRWDGKACIPLYVTESCGGLTVQECYNKGNICKWDGKACVRK